MFLFPLPSNTIIPYTENHTRTNWGVISYKLVTKVAALVEDLSQLEYVNILQFLNDKYYQLENGINWKM